LAKRAFEKKIARNIKPDSKSIYSYTRSNSSVKSSVGPLTDDSGTLARTDKEIGNILNTFFASVSKKKIE